MCRWISSSWIWKKKLIKSFHLKNLPIGAPRTCTLQANRHLYRTFHTWDIEQCLGTIVPNLPLHRQSRSFCLLCQMLIVAYGLLFELEKQLTWIHICWDFCTEHLLPKSPFSCTNGFLGNKKAEIWGVLGSWVVLHSQLRFFDRIYLTKFPWTRFKLIEISLFLHRIGVFFFKF